MWNQDIVQQNSQKLENAGWKRIGPESGLQACGAIGPGRLSEPFDITSN